MKSIIKLLFLLLLLFSAFSYAMESEKKLVEYNPSLSVQWFKNEQQFTFEQIYQNPQIQWKKAPDSAMTLGIIEGEYWMRFTLDTIKENLDIDFQKYVLDVNSPTLDYIQIYHIDPNQNIISKGPIGATFPYDHNRELPLLSAGFFVDIQTPGAHQFYIQTKHRGFFDANMKVYSTEQIVKQVESNKFTKNIFYGFFIALSLYHLLYFFIMRSSVYISYVFFNFSIVLFFSFIDGVAFKHFWPSLPILNEMTYRFVVAFLSFSILTLMNSFVDKNSLNKRELFVGKLVLFFNLFVIALAMFVPVSMALQLAVLALIVTYIYVPLMSMYIYIKTKDTVSLIFLISVTLFILSSLYISLSVMGVLSLRVNNLWDTMKFTTSIQAIIFAAAIAFRFNLINKERDKALNENNAKSEILAKVSHELRTPINGIMGLSHLLIPLIESKKGKEYNEMIHQSATSLLGVINDLLDVSRIRAGHFSLSFESVDLRHVVKSVTNALFIQIEDKDIKTSLEIDDDLPEMVLTDQSRLRQLIYNLLGNSIKFTNEGEVKVKLKWFKEKNECRFIIQDTGEGISQEGIERIFNPYEHKGKSGASKTSTGLGLYITLQLAKAMGTKIEVESVLGEGSTFWFDLKLEETQRVQENDEEFDMIYSLNVLVAEDNKINQIIIKKMLAQLNHQVTLVENGMEALNCLKENKYDFVLMDCDMPIMDGYQAVKEYREYEKTQNRKMTPILALTAHAYEGHEEKVLQCGMQGQALKPIKLSELSQLMVKILSDYS